jgi:hypothetical protein
MNNLLEKAKSMSKVVVDSGAKTMLKVNTPAVVLLCDRMNESIVVVAENTGWFGGARPPERNTTLVTPPISEKNHLARYVNKDPS